MSVLHAADWVAFNADRTPDAIAIVDDASGLTLTYADLDGRAARLAAWLRDAWGTRPNDVVAQLARNSADVFTLQWACWKLGALLLPLNWRLADAELAHILQDAAPVGLVYDAEFGDRVAALGSPGLRGRLRHDHDAPPPLNEGADPAFARAAQHNASATFDVHTPHDHPLILMYTAGTTGHPKGVLITHGMMFWNMVSISQPTGLASHSTQYVVLPTFHIGGLNLYANPLLHHGGTVIVARAFEPGATLAALSDPARRVTHVFGVPSVYLFMAQHPAFADANLSGVQSWGCGGAPMPVPLLETYAARGVVVQLGFGMTETSPTVFLNDKRRALARPESVGRPLMHTRVQVVGPGFVPLPPGTVGELVVAGPNVTPGYRNDPAANAASFTTDAHGVRWLHTGDAATLDADGVVTVVDRVKDMYLSGGENVYPAEVEQVLFALPGVADVAVIGVPDARWGERGLAVVVAAPGAALDAAQVRDHCLARLAKYKVPADVVFVDVLPRNAAGKVLKRALRTQFGSRPNVP